MTKDNYNFEAKGKDGEEEGDETERGNWSGQLDFILSVIGYAVGLGNVWRFPYQAYDNGGASFLVPYVLVLLVAGLPLFFLEMSFGQFCSLGPTAAWKVVPMFKGIGWAMVMTSALTSIQYNMIIAYTIYYTFASFTSHLPWSNCRPEWIDKYNCKDSGSYNATLRNETETWCRWMEESNRTDEFSYVGNCSQKATTPSQVYFERVVLNMSDGVDQGTDEFQWPLVVCLLAAWIVIFLCLCKGIKSSGKVVYFTAVFPYVVLIILLIKNVTLEGAIVGIEYYIIPDFSKLADAKVWYAAATQIFYSLGVGFGGLQAMASYNKFKHNVFRDSILVASINCCTSVFAGFVIFSVIGHMSVRSGLPVDKVAAGGPGLAFIAYPEGIALMAGAPFWSILFFLMLFTLGLDSQFGMMETCITALQDELPWLRQGKRRPISILLFCAALFLLGLPQCTRAGIYVVELFTWYSAGYSLMGVAIMESIAISWAYGFKNFSRDVEMMLGNKSFIYWGVCWMVITPLAITGVLIFAIIDAGPIYYGDPRVYYPAIVDNLGICMAGVSLVCIPLTALVAYFRSNGDGFRESMKEILSPTEDWGPALAKHRTGVYAKPTDNFPVERIVAQDNPSFMF